MLLLEIMNYYDYKEAKYVFRTKYRGLREKYRACLKEWYFEGSMGCYFRHGLEVEVLGWEDLPRDVKKVVNEGTERRGWKAIEDMPGKLRRVLMICRRGRRKWMGIALRSVGEGGKNSWVFEGNNELELYPNFMMSEREVMGWMEIPEVRK